MILAERDQEAQVLDGFLKGSWGMSKALSQLADVEYGRSPNAVRDENGEYPIYGSGGLVGWASKPLFDRSGVVVARKGTLTNPTYADEKYWVITTAYSAIPNRMLMLSGFITLSAILIYPV